MAKKKDKPKVIFFWLGIIVLAFALFGTTSSFVKEVKEPVKGNWDISEQVEQQNLQQFLVEEIDFDYSNPAIQQIAKDIKANTQDPYEAARVTARYVYDTIRYSSNIDIPYCYSETASSTLEAGFSDCVGMTRMNVAILRAMGIPARSSGGCLRQTQRCAPLFAVAPEIEPQVTPMTEEDFKKRGFLHEWLEFWTPETGWQITEATAGRIYTLECPMFIQYHYDTNQFDRCVITDRSFWELCKAA
jgi:transglutaminase-like putative cysteine protease